MCSISKLSTPFWKLIDASYSKLSKEFKKGIEILEGQAILKLWIKTFKMLYGSTTQEPLGLPKFLCFLFSVSWTIYYKMHVFFFQKGVDDFEINTTYVKFWLGCSTPLMTNRSIKIYLIIRGPDQAL